AAQLLRPLRPLVRRAARGPPCGRRASSTARGSSLDSLDELQHLLGRTPELGPLADLDDRALDQDRMTEHQRDQLVIGRGRIETALLPFRLALADQIDRPQAEFLQQAPKPLLVRRVFEVLDDLGLDTPFLEQRERLPGLRAARVVVDRDGHWSAPPRRKRRRSLGTPVGPFQSDRRGPCYPLRSSRKP